MKYFRIDPVKDGQKYFWKVRRVKGCCTECLLFRQFKLDEVELQRTNDVGRC